METAYETDTFYAIRNAQNGRLWWKTKDGYRNGAICDTWPDVATANRYELPEGALDAVRERARAQGIDPDDEYATLPGVVCKVRVYTTAHWSESWDEIDFCGMTCK